MSSVKDSWLCLWHDVMFHLDCILLPGLGTVNVWMVPFSSASFEGQYFFLLIEMLIFCCSLWSVLHVIGSSMDVVLVDLTKFWGHSSLQTYDFLLLHNSVTAVGLHVGLGFLCGIFSFLQVFWGCFVFMGSWSLGYSLCDPCPAAGLLFHS